MVTQEAQPQKGKEGGQLPAVWRGRQGRRGHSIAQPPGCFLGAQGPGVPELGQHRARLGPPASSLCPSRLRLSPRSGKTVFLDPAQVT